MSSVQWVKWSVRPIITVQYSTVGTKGPFYTQEWTYKEAIPTLCGITLSWITQAIGIIFNRFKRHRIGVAMHSAIMLYEWATKGTYTQEMAIGSYTLRGTRLGFEPGSY